MNHQSRTELRLKPSCLGRHDVARIRRCPSAASWKRNRGPRPLSSHHCHPLLQLSQTTDAAYKVNTLVGTEVFDAEHVIQDQIGGRWLYPRTPNGVVMIRSTRFGSKAVPLSVQIEGEVMQFGRLICPHLSPPR